MTFAICSQIEACDDGSWWEVSTKTVKGAKGIAWLQCRGTAAVSVDAVTTAWPAQPRAQLWK